jgi:uncharacterized protein (TIGR02270 family)
MPPLQNASAPIPDLVDESFDEAMFLWRRWEDELSSPTRNLDEVWSWTEDRLHGALDGIRAAGAGLIDVATAGLLSEEIDRITVSAAVLGSSPAPGACDAIAAALSVAEGDKLTAIVRGLELLGSNQALRTAAATLAASRPDYAQALCRLKRFRRAAPGDELISAFQSTIPSVQIDAVRAAGYVPSHSAEALIAAALRSADPSVKYAAVESGVCREIEQAWAMATRQARQHDAEAGAYLKLLAMLGTPNEHEIVYSALPVPELQLDAIWALGHIGTLRAAESCLAGMQYEALARASGEAYSWITGANLERDGLAVKDALPDVPAFEDDDLDANLVPEPEALWPMPDLEAVRRHWLARRPDFVPDVRHIHGQPVDDDRLLDMIETGPMLRRPDLVLELRARTRGKYDVETRAFRSRQRQMMAAGRATVLAGGVR